VLADEVLGRLGPFGQNNIIHSFLRDLQPTQIKACGGIQSKGRGKRKTEARYGERRNGEERK